MRVVSGFSWVAHSSRLSGDFLILHTPLSLDCNGCGAWRLGSTVSCLSGTEPGGQTGGLPTSPHNSGTPGPWSRREANEMRGVRLVFERPLM